MTILITGGTGKTGKKLAELLHAAKYEVLVASRSGQAPQPLKAVKFDWLDKATYENPFAADPKIDKVFLVVPTIFNVGTLVNPFIDLAISKGVKRFVLCGAATTGKGGPVWGKVHQYLADVGVEFTVLRPVRFFENFLGIYTQSIRDNDEFFSGSQDKKTPYVSVEDIAQAAFDALVAEESPKADFYVTGPETYTHNEIAGLLSEILGRKIIHRYISSNDLRDMLLSFGVEPEYATFLSEGDNAENNEDLTTSGRAIVGKSHLRDFLEANRGLWAKEA